MRWRRGRRVRAALLVALLAGACAPAADEAAVEPLAAGRADADAASGISPSSTEPEAGPTSAVPPSSAPPAQPQETTDDVSDLRGQVDRVLERYARALTDLAADPLRRTQPGTPERAAWDRTVVAGSPLSEELLDALVRRHREERRVVRPGPLGLAYRHRPLVVEPPSDGTISFTWCGWSPGIGVDADDGTVIDDGVAHSHGTGQLRLVDGHWMLELLDELDLTVLAPGSPDPCPAEVEAMGAER